MAGLGKPLAEGLGGDLALPVVTPPDPATYAVASVDVAPTSPTFRTFAVDEGGNLDFSSGNLRLIADAEAIRVNVSNRLQIFKGEWFADLDEGMPYYQTILVKNPDPNLVRAAFRDRILSTPGIVSLLALSLEVDASTREGLITWTAMSDAGLLKGTVPVGVSQ